MHRFGVQEQRTAPLSLRHALTQNGRIKPPPRCFFGVQTLASGSWRVQGSFFDRLMWVDTARAEAQTGHAHHASIARGQLTALRTYMHTVSLLCSTLEKAT